MQTVKKLVLLNGGLLYTLFGAAQFRVIDAKSSIKFTIKNFGINVGGAFSGLEGMIMFDPGNVASASFKVSIKANTVNTGNDMRDGHLKAESYFNVQQYPLITFTSTKVTSGQASGTFVVYGKLAIKNHVQDITFPFTAQPAGTGYLFKGSFTINRRDFDIGGFSIISDNAELTLSVFADK